MKLCSVQHFHYLCPTEMTYDAYFNDEECSCQKGWLETYEYCLDYIKQHNGTNESYFADYKGGIVSIYCNETGCGVYAEDIV